MCSSDLRTFQSIEHEHEHTEFASEQTTNVRCARVTRTTGGDVDATTSCDHHRARERTQQIRNGYEQDDRDHDTILVRASIVAADVVCMSMVTGETRTAFA